MNVVGIYKQLLKRFGPQGWWPIFVNSLPLLGGGRRRGYKEPCAKYPAPRPSHKRGEETTVGLLYGIPYPQLKKYRIAFRDPYFEIAVGAILTQNISWKNVACAIELLYKEKALTPEAIVKMSFKKLDKLLYCTRYHEQKAKKVKIFSRWLVEKFDGNIVKIKRLKDLRSKLLDLWGIGRETADSIMLYALNEPVFMVDEYTRRLCGKHGVQFSDYDDYKNYFEKKLALRYNSLNKKSLTKLYQEYHALIVRWGQDN